MQPDSVSFSRTDALSETDDECASPSPGDAVVSVDFTLERGVDGKLWLSRGSERSAVDVVRCFPWLDPDRFLSFRNGKGEELLFVEDIRKLDAGSRAVLADTLRRASFVLDVVEINEVTEDFELRSWRVRTAQGPRGFQTALDAWPTRLPDGSILLEDVYGDLYRVKAPHDLDAKSQKLLWAFID